MTERAKLMDQLADAITTKVVERLSASIEAQGQESGGECANDHEECGNGFTCESKWHTCSSNDFGCDSYVCANDFQG